MAITSYTAKEWQNGDVLYATALNNIENQLEDLTNAVQGYDTEFSVPEVLSASSDGITLDVDTTINAETTVNAATTIDGTFVASSNVTLGNSSIAQTASTNTIDLKAPVTAYDTVNSKNKLTVESGGLEVTTGGLTVSADGLTVSGDTILNGVTKIKNNLIIQNDSTNKITLSNTGNATITGTATINGNVTLSNALITSKIQASNTGLIIQNANEKTLINYDNENIIFNEVIKIITSSSQSTTTINHKQLQTTYVKADEITAYKIIQVGSDTSNSCNILKGQIVSGIYDSITSNPWKKTSSYNVNDKVFYNNSYYECNTAETSDTDWNNAHWDLINTYLEVVGNGTVDDTDPNNLITHTSNARTLDISGNEWIAGEISANNLLSRNSIQAVTLNLGTATTNNNVTTYSIAQFNNDNITLYKPILINNDLKISGTLFHNEYWSPGVDFYNANSTYATDTIVFNQSTQQYQKKTASDWEIIDNPYLEIIGNGTANTYSNARMLDREGNEGLAGDLVVNKNLTARGSLRIGPTALSSNITASTFLNSSLEVEGNAEFNKNVSMGAIDLVTIGSYDVGPWFLDLNSDPVEGLGTSGTLNIYSTNIKIGLSGEEENEGIVRNSTTNIYGTFIVHDSITFSASGSTVTLTKADVDALLALLN